MVSSIRAIICAHPSVASTILVNLCQLPKRAPHRSFIFAQHTGGIFGSVIALGRINEGLVAQV